ncbi:MAG TPA: sugar nucleotide-binding protein [Cellvibrionaceae bacterium]|nr:sugar nucleotide-binding protein [Cellvibrionaceae bacterium]HMW48279.1 sugar nucleotide-binding protein [Cellvibrionaceae bacterium]
MTEVSSPFAKALLRELEHHTFSVVLPGAAGVLAAEPGVLVDTRAYAGIEVAHEIDTVPDSALPIIHISSGEVFQATGTAVGFHEQDAPNGSSPRALALIAAEARALERSKTLVLRLPLLVDVRVGDWFSGLLERLSREAVLSVSETARLDPVCIKEACRVVIAMVQQIACGAENWGVMHLRSAEPCFEAEFADHLVRQLKKDNWPAARLDVSKGPSVLYGPMSVLAGRRLTDAFGVQMRSWRLGVKALLQRWMDERRQLELALSSNPPLSSDAQAGLNNSPQSAPTQHSAL